MAQSGSALVWGARGRRFESSRSDQSEKADENPSFFVRNLKGSAVVENEEESKHPLKSAENGFALLPIIVFVGLFFGAGLLFGDFYALPVTFVFLIALFVAFLQNRDLGFEKKLEICAGGAGDSNIVIMCLIYLTAGGFAGIAEASGGVSSVVNLSLSFIPSHFAVVGLFLLGCFISMAMGTSVGTVAALTPIALDVSEKTGGNLPMSVGAVVCGAMFGDNLSFISDTTIAAVRTQGCEMKEKFKANFKIVFPAAVLTAVVFYGLSAGESSFQRENLPYDFWQALPYLGILAGALCGLNVLVLLASGTVLSSLAGVLTNGMSFKEVLFAIGQGMSGMYEISIIALLVSCIGALVRYNGGFQWILGFIQKKMSGYVGAQSGIVFLVGFFDVATANNTVAIVLAGPMAKQISEKYGITPQRSASLLDISGSVFQGLLPYGAQLLSAAKLSGITSAMILPYLYYPVFMGISAFLFIVFFSRKKLA